MKKEIKIVEREETVFISDDGLEFNNPGDCNKHERMIKLNKFNEEYPVAKKYPQNPGHYAVPPFDGDQYNRDHWYQWIYIENKTDFETVVDVYGAETELKESDIGKWVCIEMDHNGQIWVKRLDDCIEYVSHILKQLGFKMTINKA